MGEGDRSAFPTRHRIIQEESRRRGRGDRKGPAHSSAGHWFRQRSSCTRRRRFWGGEEACITLTEPFTAEAFQGLSDFSHVEVIYVFHQVEPSKIVIGARHPRNNQAWPAVGIFEQRAKDRPNRIGSTICRVIRVEGKLFVSELDAIDGTPVLDIKPVMAEFLPREEVRQPPWSHDVMRQYWSQKR